GTLAEAPLPGIVTDKPRRGSRDFSWEAALEPAEIAFALDCGQRAVARATKASADLLILGEMGIGNTTSAAAVAAALLGIEAGEIAGRGTGLDTAGRERQAAMITAPLPPRGLEGAAAEPVLCAVGGLEIAAIAGAMIAAAQRR